MCEDELMYVDEKDESIKKIIFSVECVAHQILKNVKLTNSLTAKEKNDMNLQTRRKWELVAILEYFRYKQSFDLSDTKIKLIDKIKNYLIDIKKECKNGNEHTFNLKTFIDIIGDDILNIKSGTAVEIVIITLVIIDTMLLINQKFFQYFFNVLFQV